MCFFGNVINRQRDHLFSFNLIRADLFHINLGIGTKVIQILH